MTTEARWTSADLAGFPDDGKRYEIIGGELHVSKQPHWHHQFVCIRLGRFLDEWSEQHEGVTLLAPGLIFGDDDDVAPDLVWLSQERFATAIREDGKLYSAPELAIEVLSFGSTNEARDRQHKRDLYARRGVLEYWIVDWRMRQVEIYRRSNATLTIAATLYAGDTLTSPLLPEFACPVQRLFAGS